MITLLSCITVCVLTGCFLLVRGLLVAPEGYQDDMGFHFAGRSAAVRLDVLASTARFGRDTVGHVAGTIS